MSIPHLIQNSTSKDLSTSSTSKNLFILHLEQREYFLYSLPRNTETQNFNLYHAIQLICFTGSIIFKYSLSNIILITFI